MKNIILILALIVLAAWTCTKLDTEISAETKMSSRNNSGPQGSNHQDTFKYIPVVYGFDLNVLLEDTTPFNGAYLTKLRRETQRVAPLRYQLGRFDIDVADTTKFLKSDSFAIFRVVKI